MAILATRAFDFSNPASVQGVPYAGNFSTIGIQAGGTNNSSASQCCLPSLVYPQLVSATRSALIQIGSQYGVWPGNNTYRTMCSSVSPGEGNGGEFYEAYAVQFPSKLWGTNTPNILGGFAFWECHGPDNSLAPINLQSRNGLVMRIATGNWTDGFNTGGTGYLENALLSPTIPLDVPLKFIVHQRLAQTDGLIECWMSVNNAPLVQVLLRGGPGSGFASFLWDNAYNPNTLEDYRQLGIYTGTATLNGCSDPFQLITSGSQRCGSFAEAQSWLSLAAGTGIPVNTAIPTITGTTTVGQTLTEVNGSWTNTPTSRRYQWLRGDSNGGNLQPILGATAQTYVELGADFGLRLAVREWASNATGESLSADSAVTAQIAGVISPPAGQIPKNIFGFNQPVTPIAGVSSPNYLDFSGPFTTDATVSVTKLVGYVQGGGSVDSKMRAVVYLDSAGKPATFKAVSSEVTIVANQAAGWVDFPLASPVSLTAGDYWLGYWYADSNNKHFYDVIP